MTLAKVRTQVVNGELRTRHTARLAAKLMKEDRRQELADKVMPLAERKRLLKLLAKVV